ncbi:MAG: hypothetical protein V2I32_00065 [Desulforhopalus sp.]|jgi:hypothetical protein|nr:hypothetical protein [Desulforhopalus sp.]
MKNITRGFLVFFGWLLASSVAVAGELPWEKKLPFKEATIRYTISGLEEGEAVLYIRDHGRQRATYHNTVSKMMGMTVKTATVEFKDPEFIYSYDLESGEGDKMVNPEKYMVEEYQKLSGEAKKQVEETVQRVGLAYGETVGGDIQQNAAKILGYDCDRAEVMGGAVVYLIHGTDIPLKTEMNMMGMSMTEIATAVDTGPVDDAVFLHPEGIIAQSDPEADILSRNMARQAMAMLSDPEAGRHGSTPPMEMPILPDEGLSDEERKMLEQAQELMKGMQHMMQQ